MSYQSIDKEVLKTHKMESLSEDEALPNYSYQPPYNLHGLIDISSLHYQQSDNQSHHSLHNSQIHSTNEIPGTHLSDYSNPGYGNLGHSTGFAAGQSNPVYPSTISPVDNQQLGVVSNLGNSWQSTGVNKGVGRWSETRSQSQLRVEVGGIGWTDQLNKTMHRLMEVDILCDIILVFNSSQIKVHKVILSSSSDYMLTLLKRYDQFKMLQISLPVTISMEALKTFVTFLYLGKADLTSENIHEVALLANLFKVQVLKELIMKLSGDQTIGQDEKLCDLQPVILDFYEKRDQCVDTEGFVSTTEHSTNTENPNVPPISLQTTSANALTDILGEEFFCPKKYPKKNAVIPPPHNYGTRSTLTPKGTPKSRRKTYIEEITKKDLEAQSETTPTQSNIDVPKETREVYRGKKSRLLAGAHQSDSHETPKTRGKAKRKMEIANSNNNCNVVSQNIAQPAEKPIVEEPRAEDISPTRKTRQRKLSTGNQVSVRPPPKKRAKMALQLNQLNLDDLFNDLTYVDNAEEENITESIMQEVSTAEEPRNQKKEVPSEAQKDSTKTTKKSKRNKRSRMARWKKSKNIVGIAQDVDDMAEHIPEAERQFKCTLCGNEFVFSKRCISHMIKTHKVREDEIISNIVIRSKSETDPKICDICGYKTKDQNFCYIHYHKYFKHGVPLPQGWKVYKCDECGKECFTKFMLKDHKLTHVEETPFICATCGQGFKSRTCLNSHVFHRHNTVKKHPCPNCKKSFKTKTQMNVHFRTHSGEKPFKCPACDYKSTTRGNMRLHLTNRHKLPTSDVKTIMDNMTNLILNEPVVETKEEKTVASSIPMQFITIENAEIKASVQIDNDMKWAPISEVTDHTNLNSVQPTILLPVSQSDQAGNANTSYRTFLIPTSGIDGSAVPVELLDPTVSDTVTATVQPLSITSMSLTNPSQLYMQHSPISPAPTISPEEQFKQTQLVSSPITPPSQDTSYQNPSNLLPSDSSGYQTYQQNVPASISPSVTTDAYQTVNTSHSQTSSALPQDITNVTYADITQMLKIDPNFIQQNYDDSLLQVYYHTQPYNPI